MNISSLERLVETLQSFVWGWPLIIFIVATGIILTVACSFIQFRYFFKAWEYVFTPEKTPGADESSYMTPFQAFLNILNASIGNGSVAGMATAIYSGGPGAAFWIFVLGFFNYAIRFAEVFVSTSITEVSATGVVRGGPMVYLARVPGGSILPYFYAFCALMLTFVSGNAIQCNSISLGMERMAGVPAVVSGIALCLLILYILLGGAQRIIAISEAIAPFKVGLFFITTIGVLVFHYQAIIPALQLIMQYAFSAQAVSGAVAGYTVQSAIRFGMSRVLNATEAGLGTAAILFGSTVSKHPVRSGIMAMATSFISNHLVCFMIMVVIVASGTWDSGLTSTPLTIAAYSTAFGDLGGWVVTVLSISFGLGVLVAYAYIGRECWMFLFKGRFEWLYMAIYASMAFFGSLGQVALIWNMTDLINAGLIVSNLYGILYFLPRIRQAVLAYMHEESRP